MNFILQSKWKTEKLSTTKITFNMIIKSIESIDDKTMLIKFRNNFKVVNGDTIIPSNIKKYNEFNTIKVEVKEECNKKKQICN